MPRKQLIHVIGCFFSANGQISVLYPMGIYYRLRLSGSGSVDPVQGNKPVRKPQYVP
ncbi:hypothetical protein [Paenibacillus sp. Z3-2]